MKLFQKAVSAIVNLDKGPFWIYTEGRNGW